jgi:hypothetical protein
MPKPQVPTPADLDAITGVVNNVARAAGIAGFRAGYDLGKDAGKVRLLRVRRELVDAGADKFWTDLIDVELEGLDMDGWDGR